MPTCPHCGADIHLPEGLNALRVADTNALYGAFRGKTYDAEMDFIYQDECQKLYGGGGT